MAAPAETTTTETEMLHVDGSTLEGGGQLLRNTVALAALLRRPVSIDKIRHGRTPPGLKAQHTAGIQLVGELCSGALTGAAKGLRALTLVPGALAAGNYSADPGTAGSTLLLLQVALPCLLFQRAPSTLALRGGTNAAHAPQADYAAHVLLPFLRRHFGLDVGLRVVRRGYYPKGGGELHVTVPCFAGPLPAVTVLQRGALVSVKGYAFVAGLPAHVARAMQAAAVTKLIESGIDAAIIDIAAVREDYKDAVGSGSGIVLWAETDAGCVLGGSALGSKGKVSSDVANEAAEELVRNINHGGCVDEYLQDQIIVFMALAAGRSSVACGPLTLHTKTAIWVAEQLTDAKFEIEEAADGRTIIHCTGIALSLSGAGEREH